MTTSSLKLPIEKMEYMDSTFEGTHTKNASAYLSQIQDTIIRVSSLYLEASFDEIENTINKSLNLIGSTLQVDRVQVHDYDYERRECITTYEWCDAGISTSLGDKERVPFDLIIEMVSTHNKGEHVLIDDVNLLPNGLPKKILEHRKIKSVLTVPNMLDGKCVGFISFDSVKSKASHSLNEISLLKLFSNIVISFLSRSKGEKRISRLLEKTSIQNKRLRDFSYIVSHNIRSATANLGGIINLLAMEEKNTQYLNLFQNSLSKLNKSLMEVNNILDLDKSIEVKQLVSCNISGYIKKCIKNHDSPIKNLDVEIINELPKRLMIKAVPIYLESILEQVLSNALKYGISKKSRKILIDYAQLENLIDIRIKDFGNGINFKKYGSRLFQIGSRFHPESCNNLGMGLYISKNQIESMNGKISISSEKGKGFTVIMSFQTNS